MRPRRWGPEPPVQVPIVLVKVNLDDLAVSHLVDGDLLAFEGLAIAFGRPVHEDHGVLAVGEDLLRPELEGAAGASAGLVKVADQRDLRVLHLHAPLVAGGCYSRP
ncbi:MAG: hypothetical protein M3P37_12425 [Actinomycetota bacterium]|nr:hypothetical protein [Actinomycetota bacterium]